MLAIHLYDSLMMANKNAYTISRNMNYFIRVIYGFVYFHI